MACSIVSTDIENSPQTLLKRLQAVRNWSQRLVEPLEAEDCVIQSMPDVSPTRWHLAHTTWFFETFVVKPRRPDLKPFDEAYEYLFNSYYNAVGEQFSRPRRGLLSRPTVAEVLEYRRHVDTIVEEALSEVESKGEDLTAADLELLRVVELGTHHEQQHQELMLTDIKHVFSCNPTAPAYVMREDTSTRREALAEFRWNGYEEGIRWIGLPEDSGRFAFDNESPRHRQFVHAFELGDRLVTNGEYREFIDDGGYSNPSWWLSAGWQIIEDHKWRAPLHWRKQGKTWHEFTLSGLQPLDEQSPVCHVSYFEADAFARWWGGRLPTEAEWEVAAEDAQAFTADDLAAGNFCETEVFHPAADRDGANDDAPVPRQLAGDVWEWTASPYAAYPGYSPPSGALGEYNGKFMCNQYVLRGGSCATPASHIRPTYRNFFPPDARWQFSGIRLAR